MHFINLLKILTLSFILTILPEAHADLMLVGGGEVSSTAKKFFLNHAGDGPILVCHWASKEHPKREKGDIEDELIEQGASNVSSFPDFKEVLANPYIQDQLAEQILSSGGIYFAGGDQTHLLNQLQQIPKVLNAIRDFRKQNGLVAGTSAGAAFMSDNMIYQGSSKDPVEVFKGAALLRHTLIDTHFMVRHRQPRLQYAIQTISDPNVVGIGIDEGSAVFIDANRVLRLIGKGKALIAVKSESEVETYLLSPEDSFDLNTQTYKTNQFVNHKTLTGSSKIAVHSTTP